MKRSLIKRVAVTLGVIGMLGGLLLVGNSENNSLTSGVVGSGSNQSSDISHIRHPNGKINVKVFIDIECPGCAAHHEFLKDYMPSREDVRLETHHMPLSMHKHAYAMAEYAIAMSFIGDEYFDKFLDEAFRSQLSWNRLKDADFIAYVENDIFRKVGVSKLKVDSIKDKYAKEIKQKIKSDDQLSKKYRVMGTPTYIVNGKNIGSPRLSFGELDKAFQ